MGGVEDDTQREHVAAAVGGLLVSALLVADTLRERGDRRLDDGVSALHLIGERVVVLSVAGFLKSLVGERVDIDDDGGAFLGPLEVRLEGGRVHRDEDVAFVAGTVDVITHVHLIARHTGDGVVRGADFRRIIGEGGDVVACEGGSVREQRSGKLHAVARVTRKTDDDVVNFCDLLCCHKFFYFTAIILLSKSFIPHRKRTKRKIKQSVVTQ